MHVMVEVAPGTRMVEIREVVLALMAEGRVTEVMADGYGLDEVEVEAERHADGAPHPADHLQVEGAARDIVVAYERKDLCLVGATRVERVVDDLLDIHDEARTAQVDIRIFVALGKLAYALVITAGKRREHGLGCSMTCAQFRLLVLGKLK